MKRDDRNDRAIDQAFRVRGGTVIIRDAPQGGHRYPLVLAHPGVEVRHPQEYPIYDPKRQVTTAITPTAFGRLLRESRTYQRERMTEDELVGRDPQVAIGTFVGPPETPKR
jgi:hypothetical protein